jgi:hypothetical protein
MKAEQKLEKIENFFNKSDDIDLLNLANPASSRFANPRRSGHPLSACQTRRPYRQK